MLPYSAQLVHAALLRLLQTTAKLARFIVGTWYRQGRAGQFEARLLIVGCPVEATPRAARLAWCVEQWSLAQAV